MQPVYESNGFVERFTLGEGDLSFAVKDTLDVAGYRTLAGCPALVDTLVVQHHATIVETLLENGCVLNGKTTLHELAFGVTGINAWGGTPVNPLYPVNSRRLLKRIGCGCGLRRGRFFAGHRYRWIGAYARRLLRYSRVETRLRRKPSGA